VFDFVDVRCIRIPPGARIPQVEEHCSRTLDAGNEGRRRIDVICILPECSVS
jgi:hypothetical protein